MKEDYLLIKWQEKIKEANNKFVGKENNCKQKESRNQWMRQVCWIKKNGNNLEITFIK